jgi:hypothetical protein
MELTVRTGVGLGNGVPPGGGEPVGGVVELMIEELLPPLRFGSVFLKKASAS